MNRIAISIVATAFLATPTFATETTYHSDCRTDLNGNSSCSLVIDRPPPPQEPFYRGPASEETVYVRPTNKTPEPTTPPTSFDNLCGRGFQMLLDGSCQLSRTGK